MALGANRRDVFRWVLTRGGRLALFGAAAGMIVALGLTQVMTSFSTLLYGVRPYDPLTMLGVVIVLMCVAFMACYLPARRAMRIDPMHVLRTE